ncbi:MAG: hypothetical protein V1857_02610 [archaeon]
MTAFISPVEARETVTCGRLNKQVTVEGKWTNVDEWTDAMEISLVFLQGSGKAYIKAKYDDNYLYLLVDFVSDQESQTSDMVVIAVDPKNDGGLNPQKDDFTLSFTWNTPTQYVRLLGWGTGTEDLLWGDMGGAFNAAASNNVENDPYGKSPHLIYEFQIPVKLTSATGGGTFVMSPTGIGIGVSAYDRLANSCLWPNGFDPGIPDKYAEMSFMTQVVPEFSTAISVVLFLVLAVATIVLRHPANRKD